MDFTRYTSEDLIIKHYTEGCEMILSRTDNSVRVFTDITGVMVKMDTMRILRKIGKKAQRSIKKSAILGAVGLAILMLKFYVRYSGSKLKTFNLKEAALNYITQ
ncbi:hypothetical protein [Aquimarina litoralis]|uniref:hypothetical protein n=1 Tax=Aquimarina litoralis TaxID=584605 RepID=UPI001C58596E|nr:hypothetical protein [Aquimarina litoralis]MBW1298600.1 hypothetical protein [Aquimarina litoralis]